MGLPVPASSAGADHCRGPPFRRCSLPRDCKKLLTAGDLGRFTIRRGPGFESSVARQFPAPLSRRATERTGDPGPLSTVGPSWLLVQRLGVFLSCVESRLVGGYSSLLWRSCWPRCGRTQTGSAGWAGAGAGQIPAEILISRGQATTEFRRTPAPSGMADPECIGLHQARSRGHG